MKLNDIFLKTEFSRKLFAVVIIVLVIVFVDLQNLKPLLSESRQLDPNWNTAPAYAYLHDNQILGRDLVFTYGPLFQLFSVLGAKLHIFNSSIFSLHLIYYVNDLAALLLLALSIVLIPFIGWKMSILLILIINPAVNLRSTILIFTITLLVFSFTVLKHNKRITLSGLVGVAAFLAQIYLFNLGLYAIFLAIILGIFFAVVSWQSDKYAFLQKQKYLKPKEYLFSIGVVLVVFCALNLIIAIVFLNTSENYLTLFQYQQLSLSIVKGYPFLGGLPIPWFPQVRRWFSLFLGIYLLGIIITISLYRKLELEEVYYFIAYCALAGIMLKGVLVRSDLPHIEIGFRGIYFYVLIMIGYVTARESNGLRKVLLGGIFLAFSFFNGVYNPSSFVYDFYNLLESPAPVRNFSEARAFFPDQETVAENFFLLPEIFEKEERIVILGTRNYVAEFQKMEMVAPVLQEYAIMTPTLQQYYIRTIEYEEFPIVLLNYAFLLDNVYHGARYPGLFRFLLENYYAPSLENIDFGHQVMILQKRDKPKEMASEILDYSVTKADHGNMYIDFEEPIQCDMFEVTLSMEFPPLTSIVGTPGRIQVDYYLSDSIYQNRHYAIGALSTTKPFKVLISTLEIKDLWKLFYLGNEMAEEEQTILDGLTFYSSIWPDMPSDPLFVHPDYEIHSIACMQ